MPAHIHLALARSGLGAAVPSARTGLAGYVTSGMTSTININAMSYTVASTTDLTARTDILAGGTTHYAAAAGPAAFVAANPSQRGTAQVVTVRELAA